MRLDENLGDGRVRVQLIEHIKLSLVNARSNIVLHMSIVFGRMRCRKCIAIRSSRGYYSMRTHQLASSLGRASILEREAVFAHALAVF